jgi:hypothetical protein
VLTPPLRLTSDLRFTDERWDERLMMAVLVDVLTELHREDLDLRHVLVEELDDRTQFARDRVCDEHEAHATRSEIRADTHPELVSVDALSEDASEYLLRVLITMLSLDPCTKMSTLQ